MKGLFQISDRHGGRLLRDNAFFAHAAQQSTNSGTEIQRARRYLDGCATSQNRRDLRTRYAQLKEQQKTVFDEIMGTLERRKTQDKLKTDGKAFFLQGHAGTGKTYLLSLLRDMAESKGMLVEITATTGKAASLYRGGRTLHSLPGLVIDDRESTERHAKLSKYGPRSQRGELIRHLHLLIIDEASMMA